MTPKDSRCPKCNGKGRYRDHECPSCKGTGYKDTQDYSERRIPGEE